MSGGGLVEGWWCGVVFLASLFRCCEILLLRTFWSIVYLHLCGDVRGQSHHALGKVRAYESMVRGLISSHSATVQLSTFGMNYPGDYESSLSSDLTNAPADESSTIPTDIFQNLPVSLS